MKMIRIIKTVSALLFAWLAVTSLRAQPTSANSISFQGALTGAGGQPLSNGSYNLTFKFYTNALTPTALATSNVPNVPITNGLASTPIPVDAAWFDGQTRYLGIGIAGVSGGQELSPRVLVTAVPYAVRASSLEAPDPFVPTSYVQQQQGLELRWYQNTPFIDFTHSPNPGRDFDYRIYVVSPEDPRFVIGSDIAQNGIVIRRNGFVGIGRPNPQSELDINGTARMTVCQITSDRASKDKFTPVCSRDVLAKLAAVPISTWVYTNAPGIRHIGPVAQDFVAAFAVGEDDKHIATVDADGVALAAIQGLNQKLEGQMQEKDAKIQNLEKRLQALERKLESRIHANGRP